MVTDKVSHGLIIRKGRIKSFYQSYKRFSKLKDIDQKYFKEWYHYTPYIRSLALLYYVRSKDDRLSAKHFKKAICNYIKVKADMDLYIVENNYIPANHLKDSEIEEELIYQGFIPLSNISINQRFGYLMSNRPINGTTYVYPYKFADDYNRIRKGYPIYSDFIGYIGIPGIIKYQYSHGL